MRMESVTDSPVGHVSASSLGEVGFRSDFGIRYNYIAGSMYKGISSEALVIALARGGLLGFFGTGGLDLEAIKSAILNIKSQLSAGQLYGMNLLFVPGAADMEMQQVELFLEHEVTVVEASAYTQITPALARYMLAGVSQGPDGTVHQANRIIGKASRRKWLRRL